jgi:ethanolamine utilization protein EutA
MALSDLAGDFVVATAGPHLESVLAAKGAGSVEESSRLDQPVLHMDIGGGTSNLALLEDGKILRTGCLNVGGRLLKFDNSGRVTYVSPVLQGLTELEEGDFPSPEQVEAVARLLTQALEMAVGLRKPGALLERLSTTEAGPAFSPAPPGTVAVLSGGVAECVRQSFPPLAFGDLGPVLGRCIRESRFAGHYRLGKQTIRATVIGAGCHAAQLSGSTVYAQGVKLPMKNRPGVVFSEEDQKASTLPQIITQRIRGQDVAPVLYFPGYPGAGYEQVSRLADAIAQAMDGEIRVCLRQDMAKALGQAIKLRCPHQGVLCLDGLMLSEGDYLDVGAPIGPTFPVVIKTLALASQI